MKTKNQRASAEVELAELKARLAEAQLAALKARIAVSRQFFAEQANGPEGARREMALLVVSYLLQCFAHGGGDEAIAAMRATVQCAQSTHAVLRVFVQAIPGVMDWQDVARVWPKISPPNSPSDLFAIERSEVYRGDSKHVEVDIQRWRAA